MNLNDTMLTFYNAHADVYALTRQLEHAGKVMAAHELQREAAQLGKQLLQLEGVLASYRVDIATIVAGAQ